MTLIFLHPMVALRKRLWLLTVAVLALLFHVRLLKQSILLPAELGDWTELFAIITNQANGEFDPNTPQWMIDYVRWHREQKDQLTPENYRDTKVFVIRCLKRDGICGGTADRLGFLPLAVRMAACSERLLLIHWERPAPLEVFLQPNLLNWTVPEWMPMEHPRRRAHVTVNEDLMVKLNSTDWFRDSKHQTHDRGLHAYNDWFPNEPTYGEIYHSVWNTLFKPSPAVQALIDQQRRELQLEQPYSAVHIRSLYTHNHTHRHSDIDHALNCITEVEHSHDWPILVASDSPVVNQHAVEYGRNKGRRMVAPPSLPVHLDRDDFLQRGDANSRSLEELYPIFVDLYLLAGAECVSYGKGGYGRWASQMSRNSSCSIRHFTSTCEWKGNNATEPSATLAPVVQEPVVVEPAPLPVATVPLKLWDNSTIIPQWMKDYLSWHQEQRQVLNETNWQDYRYLVLRCLRQDPVCGGTSDRIASIPFHVMVANQTQRLFFIKWERPTALEEFLVPPVGGLDWRLPDWLFAKLQFSKHPFVRQNKHGSALMKLADRPMVDSMHQTHDHGGIYYDDQRSPDEASHADIYHHLWKLVFVPSPPVQAQIDEQYQTLDIRSGDYSSLHMRVKYKNNAENDTEAIENAIHCACLQEGPIYVASDSVVAAESAVQYGLTKGRKVVTRHGPEPLHIDRRNFLQVGDGGNTTASDYYSVFVDLYLLAGGRCMTYGIGGYGRWASMISANASCIVAHFKHQCNMTDEGIVVTPKKWW